MRICENCGAKLNDGDLFCPVCLEEVRLVADYETLESRAQENRLIQEEADERRRRRERRAREEARRRKRRRQTIATVITMGIIVAVVIYGVVRWRKIENRNNSFSWQFSQAQAAFNDGEINTALDYVQRALEIEPDNADARLLLGSIYESTDNPGEAITEYEKILQSDPSLYETYVRLVPLYAGEERYDDLQQLLKDAPDEDVRKNFSDYITYDPVFTPAEGQYDSAQMLEMSGFENGKGAVYYTIDGAKPDENSLKYNGPVALSEGNTKVRAVYISPESVPGHEVSGDYRIRIQKISAPKITPASGTYRSESSEKITVSVPYGYKAYYAFDEKPTDQSSVYTEPVSMPEGEHIFYAVLSDSSGRLGDAGYATYVYHKQAPTPEPTKEPEKTPQPTREPEKTPEPARSSDRSDESSDYDSGQTEDNDYAEVDDYDASEDFVDENADYVEEIPE